MFSLYKDFISCSHEPDCPFNIYTRIMQANRNQNQEMDWAVETSCENKMLNPARAGARTLDR